MLTWQLAYGGYALTHDDRGVLIIQVHDIAIVFPCSDNKPVN